MVFIGLLGLAVLMIVHESGHYLAARRFGMRVTKFSIGLGPTLWKYQPKGSDTTFQIGLIPFLAYVQIAGMNPYEEIDANDKGSYANASLWGRIVTIFAGSLANYLFASVFFFFSVVITGVPHGEDICKAPSVCITPMPEGPAHKAGVVEGDRIAAVNGTPIKSWDDLTKAITAGGKGEIVVQIEHEGQLSEKRITPLDGKIQVAPHQRVWYQKLTMREALVFSVKEPVNAVAYQITTIGKWIRGKAKVQVGGPVAMVSAMGKAASEGPGTYLFALGVISAALAAFNLFPLPALDGGRLIFLAFEAISRKRPSAKAEGIVHAIGLLVLLSIMTVVTVVSDVPGLFKK